MKILYDNQEKGLLMLTTSGTTAIPKLVAHDKFRFIEISTASGHYSSGSSGATYLKNNKIKRFQYKEVFSHIENVNIPNFPYTSC